MRYLFCTKDWQKDRVEAYWSDFLLRTQGTPKPRKVSLPKGDKGKRRYSPYKRERMQRCLKFCKDNNIALTKTNYIVADIWHEIGNKVVSKFILYDRRIRPVKVYNALKRSGAFEITGTEPVNTLAIRRKP